MTQAAFYLIVGTVLRGVIMLAAGWLVSRGVLPQGNIEDWVGAVVLVIVGIGWGLYQKYVMHVTVQAALDAPPGTTVADLQKIIATK